ncbi:hypothetical protein JOM56_014528 [Amanita muscaria]
MSVPGTNHTQGLYQACTRSLQGVHTVPAPELYQDQDFTRIYQDFTRTVRSPPGKVAQCKLLKDTLVRIGKASVAVPDGFMLSPLARQDLQNIENGHGIDWATAKAMVFGSLMLDGNDMCISGQDAGHGTFSHRHAMSVVDQKTEGMIVPLNDGLNASGKLEKLVNSLLSEMAVLGFEYDASGNLGEASSFADSIWEAQAHTDLIFCKVTTLEVEEDDP